MKNRTTPRPSSNANDAPVPPRNQSGVSSAPSVTPTRPWMRVRQGQDTGQYDEMTKPSGK